MIEDTEIPELSNEPKIKFIRFHWIKDSGNAHVLDVYNPTHQWSSDDCDIIADANGKQYVLDRTWNYCVTVWENSSDK